jgi:hypothetical protein
MGRTGLEDAHPDGDGDACFVAMALERTGLYRCPECGALAETPNGVVIGHGTQESIDPEPSLPTDSDPSSARCLQASIGPHGTFGLWLIDAMPKAADCILEVRGDGKSIAGTFEELKALANAILAFKGA